jgi:hypothetical protein
MIKRLWIALVVLGVALIRGEALAQTTPYVTYPNGGLLQLRTTGTLNVLTPKPNLIFVYWGWSYEPYSFYAGSALASAGDVPCSVEIGWRHSWDYAATFSSSTGIGLRVES